MLIVRQAKDTDLAQIDEIQRSSQEAPTWPPLDYPCVVAVEDARVAGFLVTRKVADDEAEILNLAVAPSDRRRGVAKMLVEHALEGAPGRWFLEVRESNAAAIALYTALGFRATGHRQNYYSDPSESAIVMSFFS